MPAALTDEHRRRLGHRDASKHKEAAWALIRFLSSAHFSLEYKVLDAYGQGLEAAVYGRAPVPVAMATAQRDAARAFAAADPQPVNVAL